MFRAALTSRSWVVPHRHVHVRTPNGMLSATVPHTEQVLEDGYQRSITTRSRPYQSHL
ncbi:hypothetical protein JD81_04900 [Micromonospora sagamiensis]|uniref:Uncharacterized protein n=1 Tax=Micromonospora sagamiensis TaxID=47875 RepID=A0A562WMG6_9ACTN|nr:hypothetical protein JD81_04900 [Micromonospora sagamiensis]